MKKEGYGFGCTLVRLSDEKIARQILCDVSRQSEDGGWLFFIRDNQVMFDMYGGDGRISQTSKNPIPGDEGILAIKVGYLTVDFSVRGTDVYLFAKDRSGRDKNGPMRNTFSAVIDGTRDNLFALFDAIHLKDPQTRKTYIHVDVSTAATARGAAKDLSRSQNYGEAEYSQYNNEIVITEKYVDGYLQGTDRDSCPYIDPATKEMHTVSFPQATLNNDNKGKALWELSKHPLCVEIDKFLDNNKKKGKSRKNKHLCKPGEVLH